MKKRNEKLRDFGGNEQTEHQEKMSAALEKVAGELGTDSIQAVAIAYVIQKTPYVFPIIGGKRVEHLKSNIEALSLHLSDEQISYLESIGSFDVGFREYLPDSLVHSILISYVAQTMIGPDPHTAPAGFMIASQQPHVKYQQDGKPIGHQ